MNVVDLQDTRGHLLGSRNLFSVSEMFHENSRITESAPGIALSQNSIAVAPSGYKRYVHAPTIALPQPRFASADVRAAIVGRQSCREYRNAGLSVDAVSTLAFSAMGQLAAQSRRCVPSAGGLYPLELYVAAFRVEGLDVGLYHYNVREHGLTRIRLSACQDEFTRAIFIKESVQTANAVLALTGVFGRSKIKYGERAYRFVLLEAGHAMQNMCLAATSAGLGFCPVGGFIDDLVNDVLNVDGVEEASIYLATLGQR